MGMYRESPTGAIDGVNNKFIVRDMPRESMLLFWNGLLLNFGQDYIFSPEGYLIMQAIPAIGDSLTMLYMV